NEGSLLVIKMSDSLYNFIDEFPFDVQPRAQQSIMIRPHRLTEQLVYYGDEFVYPISSQGIVLVENQEQQAIVTLIPYGQGAILYYGIDDTISAFKTTYAHPILLKRVFEEVLQQPDIQTINKKTG